MIAIACGGTGGHLFPGLAVAEKLVQRDCDVTLLVSPKDVDQQAVKDIWNMVVITLPCVCLQRGSVWSFLRGVSRSYTASRKLFKCRRPEAVLAMGGFTSAAPVLAAKRCGARTFLHESNTIPGRANRWLSRFVNRAFVGFPCAAGRLRNSNVTVTGTPVRTGFKPRDAAACRAALGLDPYRPVVLVVGGSQGARRLNQIVLEAAPLVSASSAQVQWLHLTGHHDADQVKQSYASRGMKAVVHSFLPSMDVALGAATAAVSRAGASSLAEIAAMRVPSVLVPFPSAIDNHQLHNARAFAESGAARLLEQADATGEKLANMVIDLVCNPILRDDMQIALVKWQAPQAADQIAERLLQDLAVSLSAGQLPPERSRDFETDLATKPAVPEEAMV
jgi:UDP-N-acetylglucosamine--N-acetylmuramyl-(pentapeptide) pyrophosphoryl-undecaprenol N-acetylglucosamine transferase